MVTPRRTLADLEPGDAVDRFVGAPPDAAHMGTLTVTHVTPGMIHCGEPGKGWSFRTDTGGEVDNEIGWDGLTVIGSWVRPAPP